MKRCANGLLLDQETPVIVRFFHNEIHFAINIIRNSDVVEQSRLYLASELNAFTFAL